MEQRHLDAADVAAAWNRNADRWTRSVRAGHDRYRELYILPAFLDFMPRIDGLKVIDLGCGEGSMTRRFARLGGRMTGIDISESMIDLAREEESSDPLDIRYEIASFSRIDSCEAESFDCVLSTMALMDGPDFGGAMQEAFRLLVPGGRLCFSVLHPCFISPAAEWLQAEDGSYTGLKVGHYFETSHFVEHWRFGKHEVSRRLEPFEVPRFPRTLADYINDVCRAGFRIDKIEEPRPDQASADEHPWLARWREHAPLVLFLSAVKA